MITRHWPVAITFILGAGVGFLVSKTILSKKYATLAEEEIESVRQMYRKRETTMSAPTSSDEEPPRNIPETRATTKSGSIKTNQYEEAKRQYLVFPHPGASAQQTEASSDDPEDDGSEYAEDDGSEYAEDDSGPYLIDSASYLTECENYDKVSLCYYRPDDLVVEMTDSFFPEVTFADVNTVLGTEFRQAINAGFKTQKQRNDRDATTTIWVRNPYLETDFEVVAINRPYVAVERELEELSPREKHKKATTELKEEAKPKRRKKVNDSE